MSIDKYTEIYNTPLINLRLIAVNDLIEYLNQRKNQNIRGLNRIRKPEKQVLNEF